MSILPNPQYHPHVLILAMSSSNVKYIHFNDGLTLKVENLSSQYFETCYVGLNGDPNNVDDEVSWIWIGLVVLIRK